MKITIRNALTGRTIAKTKNRVQLLKVYEDHYSKRGEVPASYSLPCYKIIYELKATGFYKIEKGW